MNILDRATELTQGEVWPNQLNLYPDGDSIDDSLIIEIIIDEESAPDSVGDLYTEMDWETFQATMKADFEWVADTVAKMTSEVQS